jgi:hypothetical protein
MKLPALIAAAVLTAVSAPSLAQNEPPPAEGGALALPTFDLTAELAPLPAQLSAHQARLAEAQAAPANDPVAQAVVGQLRTRIRLLELFIAPLPAFDPAAPAPQLQQQLSEHQAALDRFRQGLDEAKAASIGARDIGAIETKIAELTERVTRLTELTAGPPTPPPTNPPTPPPAAPPATPAPPANPPPAAPPPATPPPATPPPATPPPATPPPATPPPATPPPATPPPPAEPLRLTLGDLMSSITRIAAELDAVRALPRPLRAEAIRIVRVSELLEGRATQAVLQAMNRTFFGPLHAYLNGDPALKEALATAGTAVDQAIAVDVLADNTIVVFVGG